MPVARPETSDSRVIAHVDMDCFYVQVEQRKNPELRGLPTAVVQYNSWQGGGLIAVSYEARKYGVKRSMRGAESKQVCPQIQLVQVPVARGKADLNSYRNAGSEVVSILSGKGRCERASIDEVYLDLTDAAETMLAEAPPESLEAIEEEALKSHVLGLDNEEGSEAKENVRKWLCKTNADRRDKLLACGALIVAELRLLVLKETEFTCSAGIAHNKMLAKLASGMNKPAQQTVVPLSSVKGLLESLPIKKMKQLGGKLGSSLQTDLGVNTVGDLLQFSEEKLQQRYGINTGTWLWNIARGISGEEVEGRLLPKSHGSGKTFPGPQALKTISSVQHWLNELCEDLSERLQLDLDENKRIAHTLVLHANAYKASDSDSQKKFPSKSCPLRYGAAKIQEDALNLFQAALREYLGLFTAKIQGSQNNQWGITSLSVSASKIVPIPSGTASIMKYFHGHQPSSSTKQSQDNFIEESAPPPPSGNENYLELNVDKPQIDLPCEETTIKYAVPSLHQLEDKNNFLNDQNPCCFLKNQAQDEFMQESLPLPTSGSEHFSGVNQSQLMKNSSGEDPSVNLAMPGFSRLEQKRKTVKNKGTSSILRFFKNQDPSSSPKKLEHVENTEDAKSLLSVGPQSRSDSSLDHNQSELPKAGPFEEPGTSSAPSSAQFEQRRGVWSYNTDEIDPSVIDELPPEIQQEVRAWLRPHKRQNVVKRGSSIADYFLPTRNA
ncbi:DNA polymerase eta isoform X1 [Rosa rugosa]|uniref:DNA polymerase eta isoform X1 n=2 Tax=Rosa rugosa TaxID=74645 RepID=UPI002B40C72F|nr:DNA polymerase eta isoform X1 [Rosa rugosa]XP_062012254.1 DNA polymerase eta isoform X1 [Rosa rugosa]